MALSQRLDACAPYELEQKHKIVNAIKKVDAHMGKADFGTSALEALKQQVSRILAQPDTEVAKEIARDYKIKPSTGVLPPLQKRYDEIRLLPPEKKHVPLSLTSLTRSPPSPPVGVSPAR